MSKNKLLLKMRTILYFVLFGYVLDFCFCSSINFTPFDSLVTNNQDFGKFNENSTECVQDFHRYTNNFLSEKTFINLILYTGKGLNDLGDHKNCAKKSGNYLVIDCKHNGKPAISIGGCVPEKCNPQDLYIFNHEIAINVNKMQEKYIFNESDIEIYSPKKRAENAQKITPGVIITAFLLVILLIMQIIGYYLSKNKNQEYDTLKAQENSSNSSKILQIFDLSRNAEKLFYGENPINSNLDVFNGLRFLAMIWIIFGQTLKLFMTVPVYNFDKIEDTIKNNIWFNIFTSAPLAIDVFLLISGFFAFMNCKKIMYPNDEFNTFEIKPVLCLYLARFLRILPIYLIAFMITNYILPILHDGPIFSRVQNLQNNCESSWIYNFLLINNFVGASESRICMNWTWYISLDFQYFLIAPFIVYLFMKGKFKGLISTFLLIGLIIAAQIIVLNNNEINLNIFDSISLENEFKEFTIKPYTRFCPYLIGMVIAWMYSSQKFSSLNENIKTRDLCRYLMYLFGLFIILIIIITRNNFYNSDTKSDFSILFYVICGKLVFIIGIVLLIYPAILGKARGLIILSLEFWSPLAKSTYSVYMLHYVLLNFYAMTLEEGVFITWAKMVQNSFDNIVLSYMVGIMLTILIDYPIRNLIKSSIKDKLENREITEKTNITSVID